MFKFFLRVVFKSISRQKGKFLAIGVARALGAAIISSLLGVYLDMENKMAREFAGFGENIQLVPRTSSYSMAIGSVQLGGYHAYFEESDLLKLKKASTFWRNNIVNITPSSTKTEKLKEGIPLFAGTWFQKKMFVERENYWFGLQGISSWGIKGQFPKGPG